MTNRELLIKALESLAEGAEDAFDDGGATTESIIAYSFACPHHISKTPRPCDSAIYPWNTLDVCGPCIQEWLAQEVQDGE